MVKFVFVILACNIFFSCQSAGEIPSITFWAMGAEGEHVRQLIPQFEALHPGTRVKLQVIPWSAAHEKLLTAFAGNSLPDICQLGNTWIPEFQAVGALSRLDSLISRSAIVQPSNYFKGIWDTNILGGKVYGIPWYVDTRVLFYRSDALADAGYKQPPNTWEEWLHVSRKIKEDKERTYAVFFSLSYPDWQIPVILIMQNEGKLLKKQNSLGNMNSAEVKEALSFYMTFFDEKLAPTHMTEVSNIYQGFKTGFFNMMITGPWNVNEIMRRVPDLNPSWDTALLPGRKNRNSVAGGSSLVIFKSSRNPELTWKFVEFLSRPEIQMKFYSLSKDLPAVKKAWELGNIKDLPHMEAFYQQLQHVQATPKIAEWEQVAVKIQEYLEKVVFQRMSLDEALTSLNQEINRILEKRRWLLSRGLIQF